MNVAGLDLHIQLVERVEAAEPLGQALDVEADLRGGLRHGAPSIAGGAVNRA